MYGGCGCTELSEKTAQAVIAGHADYLLCAKDNQENLKKDIEDHVQDQALQKGMEKAVSTEKSRNRAEKRTAYVTGDVEWLHGLKNGKG